MHEFSLIQGIIDSVLPVAREHGATKVTAIALDIGRLTEVERECMDFAFSAVTDGDPLFDGAELSMRFIEPRSKCLDCGHEFEHDRFHRSCPACGSDVTSIVAGRELNIASMEIESPDDVDSDGSGDDEKNTANRSGVWSFAAPAQAPDAHRETEEGT